MEEFKVVAMGEAKTHMVEVMVEVNRQLWRSSRWWLWGRPRLIWWRLWWRSTGSYGGVQGGGYGGGQDSYGGGYGGGQQAVMEEFKVVAMGEAKTHMVEVMV